MQPYVVKDVVSECYARACHVCLYMESMANKQLPDTRHMSLRCVHLLQ